jgi:hypothetical protein
MLQFPLASGLLLVATAKTTINQTMTYERRARRYNSHFLHFAAAPKLGNGFTLMIHVVGLIDSQL